MSTTMQLTGSRRKRTKIARRSRQKRHRQTYRRLQQGLQMLERRTVLSGLPFFTGVGDLPGGDISSTALGVSQDGTVVSGHSHSDTYSSSGSVEAFRWTLADGMEPIDLGNIDGVVSSYANQASEDGSFITLELSLPHSGDYPFPSSGAYVWTPNGIVQLPTIGEPTPPQNPETHYSNNPGAISSDGGVIVGRSAVEGFYQMTVWRRDGDGVYEANGIYNELFDSESGFLDNTGTAHGVSGSGEVIVGSGLDEEGENEAFRWTAAGMVRLGSLDDDIKNFRSIARRVSVDGNVVIGYGDRLKPGSNPNGKNPKTVTEAIRWTQEPGQETWIMEGLGDLPGGDYRSSASSVSGDGSYIGGSSYSDAGSEAFVWDEVHGMRSVQDVLIGEYGFDLMGWQLTNLGGISFDGMTWVGAGINPQGQAEGWVAHLGSTADTPGISVTPTSGLETSEDDLVASASFDVVLTTEPTDDVTIGVASSDISEGTVDQSSLTFTPANWDVPQTVTVQGVDDTVQDGDQVYAIQLAPAVSTDPAYSGLDAADVSVTNLDNEAPIANALYVYDIGFDSKRGNKDWRAVFQIRTDSNGNGMGDSGDDIVAGVVIEVTFAGNTYTGTTDTNGIFTTSWIRNLGSGNHYANAVDLVLTGYVWDPLALDLEDDSDGDLLPDALLQL